jgi:hypothetical protein
LDPNNKKRIVGHGQVEGVAGDINHFKKIEVSICEVIMWCVMDCNIKLFEVNEDDDSPHSFLKDVEGTTILWEEANLQLS